METISLTPSSTSAKRVSSLFLLLSALCCTTNITVCSDAKLLHVVEDLGTSSAPAVLNWPTTVQWASLPCSKTSNEIQYEFYSSYQRDGEVTTILHDKNGRINLSIDGVQGPNETEKCVLSPMKPPSSDGDSTIYLKGFQKPMFFNSGTSTRECTYRLVCGNRSYGGFEWPQGGMATHPRSIGTKTASRMKFDGLLGIDLEQVQVYGDHRQCQYAQRHNLGVIWLLNILRGSTDIQEHFRNPKIRIPCDIENPHGCYWGYNKVKFDSDENTLKLHMACTSGRHRDVQEIEDHSYIITLKPRKNIYGWQRLGKELAEYNLPELVTQEETPLLGRTNIYELLLPYDKFYAETSSPSDLGCLLDLYGDTEKPRAVKVVD
eukprot:Lankesteria_metandrocarpae@DN5401_c1_g1_i1.p1